MTEREIFLVVLDLPDPAARAQYLDGACGGDPARRARIESLLLSHDAADSFLDNPAVNPPAPDALATQELGGEATPDDDANGAEDLQFLSPSTRPDSLGRLGHYEMLQVLGKGGFGIVFRAFDDVLQRVVAVKVMAPQIASLSPARKRFLREARSSAAIRHENVVHVYEVGEQPLPYLVMEFVPGETLQQKLDRSGPLEVSEVLRTGRQIAEGLAAAHASDLIHRDIKPANILLEGGSQKVKITDFGLARAADDASISQSGVIAGTPMFMAPEQALGREIDQRADLFSFGSVLYQMVSGRPPFRAPSALAVLKRVAEESPRPIPEIIPETPAWLCEIIAKLHAKNPDERYQSAREIADVLADCEAQLKAHAKIKDFSRIPRSKTRPSARRKWVAAALVVLLPLAAWGVYDLTRPAQRIEDAPHSAEPVKEPAADADGWVQLFNGRDLTGWKTHPLQPGNWSVEKGILVGRGPMSSHLFSERGDFQDFYLRVETKLNATGYSSIFFRCPFSLPLSVATPNGTASVPGGFQAGIERNIGHLLTLMSGPKSLLARVTVPPDTWFTLEVIARGDRIVIKVNGQTTTDYRDPDRKFTSGHIALQVWQAETVVHFRKIEVKELPATLPPPTYKNSIGMEFVIVPKGKSWLGGGKDKLGDREVVIPADFYLGKYEVTQEEWEKVMGENPSHFSRNGEGKDAVKDITDADLKRFPVESVSWDNCQLFVARLNKLEKETGWVYRLPTTVEWEYACRGGPMVDKVDSAFDFYFAKPTNTLLLEQANFNKGTNENPIGLSRACKVASYQPNVLGLYDMHGNVWEWCDDSYEAGDASRRVVRGGSWGGNDWELRAATREPHQASNTSEALGLRLARVPSGAPSPEAKTPPLAVPPFTDADVQRIAALPAAEQVEEVRKELIRRNPGFDGKMEHKIEDGVVTEFRIVTDQVTDIAPIRVFNALRVLDCSGTSTNFKPNGQLADLTPLEGMNLAALTHLNLDNTKVGDAGLAIFKDCKNLLELHLWNTKVSDAGLANFKDCKNLTLLALGETRVSDAGLANFKDCKNLTILGLSDTRVSDAGLANFKDCKNLRHLYLHGANVSDAGLANFKDCKNLLELTLWSTKVSDAGLAYFKGMPLTVLWINNTGITDLTPLQGMSLEEIHLTPKNITRGLDILRDMKSLKTIGVEWDQPWPAAEFWERYDKGEFKSGAPSPEAKTPPLAVAPFTDADVKRIAALPAAEQVEEVRKELIRRNPGFDGKLEHKIEDGVVTEFRIVTDQVTDIAPIRVFNGLRVLDCGGTHTTDWHGNGQLVDLTPLKGMNLAGLEVLMLHYTRVGDAGLASLKNCKNLITLALADTNVTDAGLEYFKECKGLTYLYLSDMGCNRSIPRRNRRICRFFSLSG